MKKIMTGLYIMLSILITFLLQLFIFNNINLFGVKTNLLLISVIIISSWFGIYKGAIYGFITGFFIDCIFGSNTFMFTINYTLVGLIIGYLNINYTRDNKLSYIYITFIATIIFEILQYIQYIFLTGTFNNILILLKQILLSSILNIILVYIVYGLVYKIIKYFEDNYRRGLTGL